MPAENRAIIDARAPSRQHSRRVRDIRVAVRFTARRVGALRLFGSNGDRSAPDDGQIEPAVEEAGAVPTQPLGPIGRGIGIGE